MTGESLSRVRRVVSKVTGSGAGVGWRSSDRVMAPIRDPQGPRQYKTLTLVLKNIFSELAETMIQRFTHSVASGSSHLTTSPRPGDALIVKRYLIVLTSSENKITSV